MSHLVPAGTPWMQPALRLADLSAEPVEYRIPDLLKRCTSSDHEGPNPLPVTEFGKDCTRRDGLQISCRACRGRVNCRHRQANPDENAEVSRRYRQDNPEKIRELNRRTRIRMHDQVFGHYGTTCACPGCGATENLSIDHIAGNGAEHRRELGVRGAGTQFYHWLIRNGFPVGFQVLCMPCNTSKKDGECCHLDHRSGPRMPKDEAIRQTLTASSRPLTARELVALTYLSLWQVSEALHHLEEEGNVRRAPKQGRAELWAVRTT